jgi:hypothetical protein
MEYQYVTSISAQKTVKNFSKTDETAEVGLGRKMWEVGTPGSIQGV